MKYFKYILLIVLLLIISIITISYSKNDTINIKEIEGLKNEKIAALENYYSVNDSTDIEISNTNTNSNSNKNSNIIKSSNSNTNSNTITKPLTTEERINKELNSMSLEEKIGQMLIISISGNSLTDNAKKTINTYHPGGVILFDSNLSNINNTRNFIKQLQSISKTPLFISVDQEGGTVQRLAKINGTTNIPNMEKVGKKNDKDLAYKLGIVMGEELKALGFNMNFAPVMDISTSSKSFINNRSFGSNPNLVATLGTELAKGLESRKVIAVYKHFPGHGSTTTDSHDKLPILSKTKDELYEDDLIPFKKAIDNGAKVIMIGHLAIPNIDGNIPASLSKEIITKLLKEELGYNGLVITDALNMGALTKNYTEKQIYEMAINAGVDILLMPKSSKSAIKYIKQSINEGKISVNQINSSVKKILTLKYTNLDTSMLSTKYIGSTTHKNIINQIN